MVDSEALAGRGGASPFCAGRGGGTRGGLRWRRLTAFLGPGYLVAAGYMDPGNWATDLYGGSAFGYTLLSVVLGSSLAAMLLQHLAIRLGVASGMDLAQACRARLPRGACLLLWGLCEIAICACDLAELIGAAIALQLLFGVPLLAGVALSGLDSVLVLLLQRWGFRRVEAFVMMVLAGVGLCFAVEVAHAAPDWTAVARGFVPRREILSDPRMLYVAIGIVGATVMPHNLYLHSALVKSRAFPPTLAGRREAVGLATADSNIALTVALAINAAILVLAAAVFHRAHGVVVAEIQDAYRLLAPAVGWTAAPALFALALLGSGQNSAITATLAGQVVMEGFLELRLPPVVRRLLTRGLAIAPALVVAGLAGEHGVARLLVLSQVVLSLQLPFAAVPLVAFVADRRIMNGLAIPPWLLATASAVVALIIALNAVLLVQMVSG